MKKSLLSVMVFCGLLAFGAQANALPITPESTSLIATGNQTSNSLILTAIQSYIGSATELYKSNSGAGGEDFTLAGNYSTSFTDDPATYGTDWRGATISYDGGSIVGGDHQYLLVKDGNHNPVWYLFDLTGLWNGTDDLVLSDFWPGGGSISHVSLFGTVGTTNTPVPEPATMLLLGAGLVGLACFRRKFKA